MPLRQPMIPRSKTTPSWLDAQRRPALTIGPAAPVRVGLIIEHGVLLGAVALTPLSAEQHRLVRAIVPPAEFVPMMDVARRWKAAQVIARPGLHARWLKRPQSPTVACWLNSTQGS